MICVTNTPLPGVWPCTISGAHKVTCRDHEGWQTDLRPGTCTGCLPVEAETGHLCRRCYERVVASVAAWPEFKRKLDATEGVVVSREPGGATPDGYSNLSLVFLFVHECEQWRASLSGTVDVWVQTEAGAADAIQFAAAAARAWEALPVEPREQVVSQHACHECGVVAPYGNDTHRSRGVTVVTCRNCGVVLDMVRPDIDRWFGSATCEHLAHVECFSLSCACPCHGLGERSRPGGVQALWDADQAVTVPGVRAGWEIRDALTIQPIKQEVEQ